MRTFFLSDPGCYLRYLQMGGQGAPCVYLHGLGSSSSGDFPEVAAAPPLSGYQSFLLDLLGFGYSDGPVEFGYSLLDHARTVVEVLECLSLHQCRLVGYSMGGSIAVTVAFLRPDLVSHLVLVESNLDPGGGVWSKRITSSSEDEYCAHGHTELLEEIVREGRTKPNWAALAGNFAVAAPHAVYRSSMGLVVGTKPSMRENLIEFKGSRTYILGEDSLPNDQAVRLQDHGVRVPIVPKAGHHMLYENPHGFISVLAESLQ